MMNEKHEILPSIYSTIGGVDLNHNNKCQSVFNEWDESVYQPINYEVNEKVEILAPLIQKERRGLYETFIESVPHGIRTEKSPFTPQLLLSRANSKSMLKPLNLFSTSDESLQNIFNAGNLSKSGPASQRSGDSSTDSNSNSKQHNTQKNSTQRTGQSGTNTQIPISNSYSSQSPPAITYIKYTNVDHKKDPLYPSIEEAPQQILAKDAKYVDDFIKKHRRQQENEMSRIAQITDSINDQERDYIQQGQLTGFHLPKLDAAVSTSRTYNTHTSPRGSLSPSAKHTMSIMNLTQTNRSRSPQQQQMNQTSTSRQNSQYQMKQPAKLAIYSNFPLTSPILPISMRTY
ncbi:MAG: hypothetical protein EZS28_048492, partial [Streblomastix strix]